jgi:hydroxyacylglutathione hydrolase
MDVLVFKALNDNYGFAVKCADTHAVALVDAPEEGAIVRALEDAGWGAPSAMLNTHWHGDHVGANEALRARYPEMRVYAPAKELDKIGGVVNSGVREGDVIKVGNLECVVRETPGHTLGHVVYHFASEEKCFVGDTLFALGCGRLFEGTPAQMWASISKILEMPDSTEVYCAHEYTQSNARFALSIDPKNEALAKRSKEIDECRARGEPTVPTTVGLERLTNPFCRPDSLGVQEGVNMIGSTNFADVFGAVRRAKDRF